MHSKKLFFLHNPKAGGSSLRSLFSSVSNEMTVAPQFMNAPEDYRANKDRINDLKGYDLYFGHYGYEVYRIVDSGHTLVTNFRDPVRRIYSIYRFWRHNVRDEDLDRAKEKDASLVRLAKELSFSDFIRVKDEDLLTYINNFHFRQIYSTGWVRFPLTIASKWAVYRRISRMP